MTFPAQKILPDFPAIPPFSLALTRSGLNLFRKNAKTMQVNIGLKCNQTCTHCHLDAGPHRHEMMGKKTMTEILRFASSAGFEAVDITGGAPELHPDLLFFMERLSGLFPKMILRSNLSALFEHQEGLLDRLVRFKTVIVASFPSLSEPQAEAVRGKGVFRKSLEMIRILNDLGYGREGTGLELNLVVNPSGAFLPTSQQTELENRFKRILLQKWEVGFNHLFSFANVPLGRYREWLIRSGNYRPYMEKLVSAFNPRAVECLMCRTLLSVSWDGYLFDCDFNQAAGLPLNKRKIHVSQIHLPPEPGIPIATGEHCYTCTAGAGFT
ncbi:MAG: arsenosugar biosynthesis radical SAM (seleno)protein ArsS [Pseudomonadota bacterium]